MADKKLAQLRTLFAKMPEGAGKDAVAKKIAKLEASQPKEVVEVKEKVKVETKKAKAPRKPKATKSASGKEMRHVFEKEVEGGKEVKVVIATSPELAKEAMQESGFEFVKTITRGRSPKEGFIATGKAKKTKAKAPARASKATRESMAKDAGMTAEKAEKVASKVASSKKRGRKPMDKKAFLFEMPLKTQAGKVKRKVVTATSEASAMKAAGKNYTLVKELEKGENPKVGVQPVEGFVAPAPKKRGRKPKAKTLEEVTEKSEAIGEGIAIADKAMADFGKEMAEKNMKERLIGEGIAIADKLSKRVLRLDLASVMDKLQDLTFRYDLALEGAEKVVGNLQAGATHLNDLKAALKALYLDDKKMARGGMMARQEREDIKKASEAMYDHLDKVGMSLDDLGGVGRDNQGKFDWFDDSAGVGSDDKFLYQSDATEDFTKYLKKAYPAGKKMAHGGKVEQWANDENAQLGKWLMKNGVGKAILRSSTSASDLEAKIMSRGKRRGEVAGLEYDNEDVGLQWVAWSDLWDELMSRGVINKNFVGNGKK
jgi:hypothetical protein